MTLCVYESAVAADDDDKAADYSCESGSFASYVMRTYI